MSYFTDYTFFAYGSHVFGHGKPAVEITDQYIRSLQSFSPSANSLLNDYGRPSGELTDWPSVESEMIEFSSRFPDVLFMIQGQGADPMDIWRQFFMNSKTWRCEPEITWPDFDTKYLEPLKVQVGQ